MTTPTSNAAAPSADESRRLDPDSPRVRRLRRIAQLLDNRFRLPGTRIRFGYDAIVGLVPGAGDLLTTLIGLYIVLEARRLGATRWTVVRMLGNLGIDFVAGAVPLVGDLLDVALKANVRNLRLLGIDARPDPPGPS